MIGIVLWLNNLTKVWQQKNLTRNPRSTFVASLSWHLTLQLPQMTKKLALSYRKAPNRSFKL